MKDPAWFDIIGKLFWIAVIGGFALIALTGGFWGH
jgi:hypothetical protein